MAMLCGHTQGVSLRPSIGFVSGTALRAPSACTAAQRGPAALSIQARYRGINTDRSQVTQFRRFEADTGSSEVQVAQLSARVVQLTTHLQAHTKDHASTRGLMKVLSRRKSLLEYIKRHDRPMYERVIKTLGIRGLKEFIG